MSLFHRRRPATARPQTDRPATARPEPGAADVPVQIVEDQQGNLSVPPSVRATAAWSWRVLVIGAALAACVYVVGAIKVIVVPIAIAILLTVLLTPVRNFLERRLRFRRGWAAGAALVGLLVLVAGLVTVAGRSVVGGFQDLADQAKAGFDEFVEWLNTGPLQLDVSQVSEYTDKITATVSNNQNEILAGALGAATTVGHVLTGALITLFCTYFFLQDGRVIWGWTVGLMPERSRDTIHQAGRRGFVTLSAYARTQILVAFVDSLGIGIGAAVLGVPLAVPLAILVFVGAFVPVVGAVLSGTVAVLVALVANGWVTALILLGVVLLVQQIEGHLLQPFLMGHALSLHPVAVLLAVAAGGFTVGILGALFAVPIVAVINTVVLYFHGHDKFPELGQEDHLTLRGKQVLPDDGETPLMVRRAEVGLLVASETGAPRPQWQDVEAAQRVSEWRERFRRGDAKD